MVDEQTTKIELTPDQLSILTDRIYDRMREDRLRDAHKRREQEAAAIAPKVHKLYLVSFGHQHLAFPMDGTGRAVMEACAYARVAVNGEHPDVGHGEVEILAHGDGRVLDKPLRAVLSYGAIVSMIEIDEPMFLANSQRQQAVK